MQDNYLPTTDDITLAFLTEARVKAFTQLKCDRREIDVVEQRGCQWLKKRWGDCFKGIPTLIFLYDLTEYDHYCHYPIDKTGFGETIEFFRHLAEGKMFADTTFILYLVKVTEFQEKLRRVPLSRYISGYTGENNACEAAAYIRGEFAARMKSGHRLRTRICDYSDPLNVDFLFSSVDHSMRQRAIMERFGRGELG